MKLKTYNNNGDTNVAFIFKKPCYFTDSDIKIIAEHNNLKIHLYEAPDKLTNKKFLIKLHKFIAIFFKKNYLLDLNSDFRKEYENILSYVKLNKVSICLFLSDADIWTKPFLDKLKKQSYTACYLADDPEGSRKKSKPFVKYYDYAFCGGIFFNENERIEDKYLEWGARKSMFIPLGVRLSKYIAEAPTHQERSIDLVYIGKPYGKKIFRLLKLKKHFGDRMKIYGRGWKEFSKKTVIGFIASKIYNFNFKNIQELSEEEFIQVYRNTKIGFNFHQSYGPSNRRMFELPMNGVMQICDCEEGLKELYVLDNEVVSYGNIKEAINKIEFYLKNDGERVKIAKNGYLRTKSEYKVEFSFQEILKEIKKDTKFEEVKIDITLVKHEKYC